MDANLNRLARTQPACRRGATATFCFFSLLLALLGATRAPAQDFATVQLAWEPTSDANVVGYTVFYGSASGYYEYSMPVGADTTATITYLENGTTYFFTVTAYDKHGVQSDPSNEIAYTTPGGTPPNLPPTMDPIDNIAVPEDAGGFLIQVTGITAGGDQEDQVLTVTAASSNPLVIPDPIVDLYEFYGSAALLLTTLPGAIGIADITVTVDDGASRSNRLSQHFRVTVGTPVLTNIFVEAESGSFNAPLVQGADPKASGQAYLFSAVDYQGTVVYRVAVPQSDEYLMWCRVVSPDNAHDSFLVSVDGGTEDVFDTAPYTWSTDWQWTRLNGRVAGNPRRLVLAQGVHTFTFRCRESYTCLDAFYITNDPTFVPVRLYASAITSPTPGMALSFSSPPGYRYAVQMSEDLRTWTTLWRTSVASANQHFSYVDSNAPAAEKRFYRLLVQ